MGKNHDGFFDVELIREYFRETQVMRLHQPKMEMPIGGDERGMDRFCVCSMRLVTAVLDESGRASSNGA